ncbi:MAG TPA: TolC family protein [Polyangiaceae bacterium]|nr:TolC family protein [Polyangiaceae bacterium]
MARPPVVRWLVALAQAGGCLGALGTALAAPTPGASAAAPAASAPAPPTRGALAAPATAAIEAQPAPRPAEAAEAADAAGGYTLRQCLVLAEKNHPNILAAEARLRLMRAQLDEAHFAPYSDFTLSAGAGPAPTFRGGQIYTQDREVGLTSSVGMFWRAGVEGTIPIWTFGKITSIWRAAEAQVRVGEYDVRKQRNLVRQDVRRAYFGLQLSRDSQALLREAESRFDKAITTMTRKVEAGDADEVELLRLRVARAELGGRAAEAEKYERVALAGLRFLTGVGDGLDIPQKPLRPPKHRLGPVTTYLDAARAYRPEINMARAGVAAREAQADLARAKMLPDFGVTLAATYARAPEITDQLNPFVRDDANFFRYGFAFGLKWKLDFLPAAARARQAEAQLAENKQVYRFALGGVGVEVQTAYANALEARKKFEAYQEASKLARRWLLQVNQGMDLGTYEEKDLVEPSRQYALQRFNYLAATLDYNNAMSNLALVTGWDNLAEVDEDDGA